LISRVHHHRLEVTFRFYVPLSYLQLKI